jgi:hypothetical protein
MHKVFTQILPCGILPALSQYISWASEQGIFENHYYFRCCWRDVPTANRGLLDSYSNFEAVIGILPMCTSQHFFQTFCTRVIESTLLEKVQASLSCVMYVFLFDFWK